MEESELSLRQLLNLSDEEINNSKIALCRDDKKSNKYFYDIWKESGKKNVGYVYCNSENKKNYAPGQIVFGFAQIPGNNKRWVLITVGKILESRSVNQICEYESIEKYNGMLGRLFIELATGKRFGFSYNLKTYIDMAKVISIDDKNKNVVEFKGFNQVYLDYNELCLILSDENSDYYKILSNIKGVYCLTDRATGKLYIGSAYGNDGIAGRWKEYMSTFDGGNKKLIDLKNKMDDKYIKKFFTFTLIEFFGMNISSEYVLERENYWKKVFNTIEKGYNCN